MHEISVLYKMLDSVEQVAKANQVQKIRSIEIDIGELSGMLPVFFEQYYPAATENKPLFAGSKLIIRQSPGEGLCQDCKTLYNIMRFEGRCPKCHSRNKKVLGGQNFTVKNITV